MGKDEKMVQYNDKNSTCEICERHFFSSEGRFLVGKPYVHHMIPKQKFRGKLSDAPTILICSRCHKQLHRLYDNSILKKKCSTLKEIKCDLEMQKFVYWLRKGIEK